MTDTGPTPPNRQDPYLDPVDDGDEPAFDWMKPATTAKPAATPDAVAKPAATTPGSTQPAPAAAAAKPAAAPDATQRAAAPATTAPATTAPATTAPAAAPAAPGSRADRKAAEAAAGTSGASPEPLHTSALQIRPPEEEVERRNAEREHAANTKPVLPRVMQVLLAVCYPVILLVLAVRAVTSPLFLWVEYNRPGFPGDGYGFSTDDRMTYGSYAVDYLSNWAGPRYLGELVDRSGDELFKAGEVSHMADVKLVILSAFGAGILLILLSLIAVIYLRRRSTGGVRRGLFAGSIVTLVIISGLGVLAVLGWEQFFTEFHRVFFANGTWTFSLQDTLIRLFPGQFWVDAGIVIGALVLLASLVTLILTWPTRRRRGVLKTDPAGTAAGTAADDAAYDTAADNTTQHTDAEPAAKRSLFKRGKNRNAGDGAEDQPADADTGSAPAPADGQASRGHSSSV